MTTSSMVPANPRQQTINIAFLSFIGLGMTSGLLGLAWPSMQKQFNLPLDGVNTLILVQTIAYTIAGFSIGRIMVRLGSGPTLIIGGLLMTGCMFGIAVSQTWLVVIAFGLLYGLGTGVIDAALNFYVAAYHSAQQMSWLHASFGIGVTIGPLVMTFALAQKSPVWQLGYLITGGLLLIVVVLLLVSRKWWRNDGFQHADNTPVKTETFVASLRVPAVWLSILTFLAYVGLEVSIGQWAYTILTESRNMLPEVAGPWVSIYWGSFTVGRILFGVIANRFPVSRILQVCMLVIIGGAVLFFWNPTNTVGLIGLLILGFAQAPVFPMFMAGTAKRVGPTHAANAISLQMGGVGIGTAVMPSLIGTLGKNYRLEVMALVFLVLSIVVFAFHEFLRTRPSQAIAVPASSAAD